MLLTAERIHNGYGFLPEGSVLETDQDGLIVKVHEVPPPGDIRIYEGILCPGFVNAHCHLELSHMKGIIPEHTSLIPFLQRVPSYRLSFSDEQKKAARHEAYLELFRNGVVAVGDIANVEDTLDLRQMGKLRIHSFIESIGFTETHASGRMEAAIAVYEAFVSQAGQDGMYGQSIVPHAPYSVSPSLFRLINDHGEQSIISIHNQESAAEDEYYQGKTGAVRDLLGGFGIDDSFFTASGKSSLQTYLPWFSPGHPFIFVHNTWTQPGDISFAHTHLEQAWWCICPNANLYIENRLPDIPALMDGDAAICIGTDSLASNHQLSIVSELVTIRKHFPEIDWEVLLTWATINGAKALGMGETIGSFEPGKKPGLVQLTGLDNADGPQVLRVL